MEDNIEDLTDRISQVPESIIHHIMSFLDSPKDLVRMSVLSKNLFSLTASFPNLDLDVHKLSSIIWDTRFMEIIFCQQNVTRGHTLKLITKLQDPTIIDLTYRCLRLILTKGVQVLEIDITRNLMHIPPYGPIFRLPDILLSVSSLTSLKLCNCEWPSSLMVNGVKFKSLKLLRLEYLRLDEEVIKILTTGCPLLEELTVIDCSGFKRFCVYGLQNLQIVRFCYEYGVERIDIEAPNLCFLLLSSSHEENVTLPCDHIDDFEELKLIQSAPYELEHVELARVMIQEVPAYLALVEAIL
ncbi:F-box domain containing protein, partial [Tanacetum coccineum]